MKSILFLAILITAVFAIGFQSFSRDRDRNMGKGTDMDKDRNQATAVFAGGCFWCTESDFEKIEGVLEVISGYTGGSQKNPTYEEVSSGTTGHIEAVKIVYDPTKISYKELVDILWRHINPTDPGGQFVDRGSQYRSAIFYGDEEEKRIAEQSKTELEQSGIFDKPIVTEILKLESFYRAEDYHQDYFRTNPMRYKFYRSGSGRDQFLKKTWDNFGKDRFPPKTSKENEKDKKNNTGNPKYSRPSDEYLRKNLTALQYKVVRNDGTEPPFNNDYWDNKKEGIYVDIASGEPLFSSLDKFKSGTGWPSFTRALEPGNVLEKEDRSLFISRTEVRSTHGDSHLGHVFPDGPQPTGLRYCINSAALRFIPVEDLEEEGYGDYLKFFQK